MAAGILGLPHHGTVNRPAESRRSFAPRGERARVNPGVAEIPANVGRMPIGALSLRAIFLPSADFTEGDIANPSRKCAHMRKTGGLTPAVRLSLCNYGVNRRQRLPAHRRRLFSSPISPSSRHRGLFHLASGRRKSSGDFPSADIFPRQPSLNTCERPETSSVRIAAKPNRPRTHTHSSQRRSSQPCPQAFLRP